MSLTLDDRLKIIFEAKEPINNNTFSVASWKKILLLAQKATPERCVIRVKNDGEPCVIPVEIDGERRIRPPVKKRVSICKVELAARDAYITRRLADKINGYVIATKLGVDSYVVYNTIRRLMRIAALSAP